MEGDPDHQLVANLPLRDRGASVGTYTSRNARTQGAAAGRQNHREAGHHPTPRHCRPDLPSPTKHTEVPCN